MSLQDGKPKGVAHLIDIENPNHVVRKTKKVSELDGSQSQPALTRKQRYSICHGLHTHHRCIRVVSAKWCKLDLGVFNCRKFSVCVCTIIM